MKVPRGARARWEAAILWAALTGLGEFIIWRASIFPGAYAEEARVSDTAFRLLMRLSVPVFAFVIAVLVVSVLRFRVRGAPVDEGPPVHGSRRVYAAWLAATTALTGVLIVNPGLVGLAEIRGGDNADLVVRIEGARWFWTITYPGGASTSQELVLPEGERVRFEVSSRDVVHSMWVPAFRVKIDAVPGRTTVVHATPTAVGANDFNLRVVCAELCGLGHATMAIPVRILSVPDFQTWLAALTREGEAPGETCEPSGSDLRIGAVGIAFDTHCLAAPANKPFTISFQNMEAVPHNVSIARDAGFTDVHFTGEIFTGPGTRTYRVGALPAGRYFFRCDVHPIPAMSGSFVVSEEG